MALPRWLTVPTGYAIKGLAAGNDLIGAKQAAQHQYAVANSIIDPSVVYKGGLTIGGLNAANDNKTSQFAPVQKSAIGQPAGGVGGSNSQDMGGAYGATGAGGASSVDSGYRNNLMSQIRSLMSAYDALGSGADTAANDAISQYNKQYDQQGQDLQNEYSNASQALAGQYGARGLGDSSYYGGAQDQAAKTYQSNLQSLADQRNSNLSSIGQQLASTKAGYAAAKNQYGGILGNIGQYDQSALNTLGGNVSQGLADVGQAQAGQGTQGHFLQSIQGLPALQNNGGSALQAQLQKLAQTGTPGFAKNQIAQGLISQGDPSQQNQWSDYWKQLAG